MPRIVILGTGGTIQNTESGRLTLGQVIDDLRTRGPLPVPSGVELAPVDLLSEGAENFGPAEWLEIASAVEAQMQREDVDGVVVTHGTFTAEETAFVLHLVVRTEKPVVVAVSQRKHGMIGNDGDRNLLDAVRVAAEPAAAGIGVVLVASDEIHSARDVTKENQRLTGFRSALGPMGTIEPDRVSIYRRPQRRHTAASAFDLAALRTMPRVDIVAAYPGADATAIDAFVAAGAQGLVTAGYAYSGVTGPVQMQALRRAADGGVVVALASRGRGGRVPEAGRDWCVRADNLSPHKARILLGLALTATRGLAELQELFDTH
jgi:L-asparaginase